MDDQIIDFNFQILQTNDMVVMSVRRLFFLAAVFSLALSAECTTDELEPTFDLLDMCRSVSKLPSSPTAQDYAKACTFGECAAWLQLLSSLSCTVSGLPTSSAALICRNKTNTTVTNAPKTTTASTPPPTTKSTSTECTTNDLVASFPAQLKKCLFAAGLPAPPTTLVDLTALCKLSECSQAIKLYMCAGDSCTVFGAPASYVSSLCMNIEVPVLATTLRPPTSQSSAAMFVSMAAFLASLMAIWL
ncbi:hypothetical protein AeMF1_017769 [Aphanomyces euteiches]|nr:hypothetical protein AeMF1_017769 [Aphanomyces euteiches]